MKDAIPEMLTQSRRVPMPVGLFTGRRTWLRRLVSWGTAAVNRSIDLLPIGRWLHMRIQRALVLTQVEMPLAPRSRGLDGLRVAFLTDLHAGSFMNERDLRRVFARVAAERPHLVLFGGDLINTRERELLLLREGLRRLSPPLGMFAVPGNHDLFWGKDLGLWRAFLEEHGVKVLCNRGVRLTWNGTPFWLCGVDDLTEGEPDLRLALAGRGHDEPTILLSHHPDYFFEAAASGVDLTLSGHTHGGQIRVRGKAPLHHSKFGYEQGWFVEGDSRLYVSRGVGVTFLPIRIDAPPEAPIFTMVAQDVVTPRRETSVDEMARGEQRSGIPVEAR